MSLASPTQSPERATYDSRTMKLQRRQTRRLKLFEPALVRMAAIRSFAMLDPRNMARNPVMFLVEVGWVLTTIIAVDSIGPRVRHGADRLPVDAGDPAALDRPLRQLRRGPGRGARQGPGAKPSRDAAGYDRVSTGADRRGGRGLLDSAQDRRPRGRRDRADHPDRRRDRRRAGIGRRVGDHGRERPGDPRGRRRPLGRDGRDPGPLRPDRRRGHRRSRARVSSTG